MRYRKVIILILFFLCIFNLGALPNSKKEKTVKESAHCESAQDNPFGFLEFLHWNHSWNNYKYPDREAIQKSLGLMKKAGAGFVRFDFLWQDIEPKEGEFQFAKYDTLVNLAKENNIQVLGILDYSVEWASSCRRWNCPPVDNKLFVNFTAKVIQRYKDRVKYWEIWNEPDSGIYWTKQDCLKSYCDLLREVYLAAKKIDPDCKILNGGLASGIASVNHLYDNGAKDCFDILNIHIFESPQNPGAIKSVIAYPRIARKIMKRNGDGNKELWITEIGCPGVKSGLKVGDTFMGRNPTERRQAEWVKQVYDSLLAEGLANKIFWAFFRDTKEHWKNGIDYFGLIRWDFSLKPGFLAYQQSVKKWEKLTLRKKGRGW
jgi:hypothetical protein